MNSVHQLHLPPSTQRLILWTLFLCLTLALVQMACVGTGACVGSGGDILDSPVCKNDWSRAECQEWDDEGINDADWDFHAGRNCEGLGYTERCSDGSYRLPGACW
jgi:hypothetical protein